MFAFPTNFLLSDFYYIIMVFNVYLNMKATCDCEKSTKSPQNRRTIYRWGISTAK